MFTFWPEMEIKQQFLVNKNSTKDLLNELREIINGSVSWETYKGIEKLGQLSGEKQELLTYSVTGVVLSIWWMQQIPGIQMRVWPSKFAGNFFIFAEE